MPTAGIYTYKVGDTSGKVELVQEKWRDGAMHWVIRYNQGWKPAEAGLRQTVENVGQSGTDQEAQTEIDEGNLTPASGGRRRRTRRTRRKSRARKSRRSRK